MLLHSTPLKCVQFVNNPDDSDIEEPLPVELWFSDRELSLWTNASKVHLLACMLSLLNLSEPKFFKFQFR